MSHVYDVSLSYPVNVPHCRRRCHQGVKTVKAVERVISVLPSHRSASIKVFHTTDDDDVITEISDGTTLTREAGSSLSTLST